MDVSNLTNKRVIRRPEVKERCGLRDSALTDAIQRGEFPAPLKVSASGRTVVWLEAEIDAWLEARLAQRAQDRKQRASNAPAPMKLAKRAPDRKRRAR